MIVKSFELQKLKSIKSNTILVYGENEGFKNQIINDYFIKNFKEKIERYEESEILLNFDVFLSGLMNKSFFDKEKLIIISRATDKILKVVNEIKVKNIIDIKIVINAGILDKKSKLREKFEKEKELICIPFYADDHKTLNIIVYNFFKNKKISISQETINILINRVRGDRKNLNNELEKIANYIGEKSKVNSYDIFKLTNLAENYSISELVDNCLSKNIKKTVNILNENNFSSEDCMLILRTFLNKSKRILRIKKELDNNKSIDDVIYSFKPPIFWKDKTVVKEQTSNWSLNETEKLIYKICDIEILVKKNSQNSLNIVSDFILNTARHVNN